VKITIDNHDGLGARDYTRALSALNPLTIMRSSDAAARCTGALDLNDAQLPVPQRHASAVVTNESGTVLFSGTMATTPERICAGVGTMGAVYRLAFAAIADGVSTRSVVEGSAVTHAFGDDDGVLHIAAPATAAARELATDITVSGDIEPAAYITEYFMGDGATTIFQLTQAPFVPSGSATLLDERFDTATINTQAWMLNDGGGFLRIGSAGLTMSGGNGLDGQTTLALKMPVEMAGTLVLTADGVVLDAFSDGVLCGLYTGAVERDNCVAGFNVRQSAGNTVVTPMVNGAEAGTSLTMVSGHRYTLRLRVHSPECVRTHATYTAIADGAVASYGGDAVDAPMTLVFEARDLGDSSNTPETVLYTGTVAASPALCTFAVVDSVQLVGSMANCGIERAGSAWVVTTLSDGTSSVRIGGDAGDGVDYMISAAGRITFFSGRVPVANELIAVSYRGRRRAVARLGTVAGGAWQGKASRPSPRTTVDCENAAQAALRFAAARGASLAGTYAVMNPADDILPGDVLSITSGTEDTLQLVVESVALEDAHARPELVTCRVHFANGWSTSLNVSLGGTLAVDALVPVAPSAAPAAVLENLSALQVVSATETVLEIDAGVTPPATGGFEVRRRDWAFGPGADADLVLRSPVRSFSIPRTAQVERFFVRMYDGAGAAPVYSRFSNAVFTNLPVA
jgi:hypothetical protein